MIKRRKIFILFLLTLFIFGCTQSAPDPLDDSHMMESYPAPKLPVESENGYPVSNEIYQFAKGPEFYFNEPLLAEENTVSGRGPANVPIKLVNVSEVGTLLSETTITEDETFMFNLDQPLKSGHIIGIQLGNIEGTDFNESEFLYSDTYFERPYIGILFAMAVVE